MTKKFTARRMVSGANLWNGDDILGSFHTLEAAQAVANLLNVVMDMPFAEIGSTTEGADANFGRERVAHFVAKALGQSIALPEPRHHHDQADN